jgi:hypothetical protein
MCLNETYSKVRIGKHLAETFLIQNGLKEGDALTPLLFNSALEYAIGTYYCNSLPQQDLHLQQYLQGL